MKRLLPISLAFAAGILSVDAQVLSQENLNVKPNQMSLSTSEVQQASFQKVKSLTNKSVTKASSEARVAAEYSGAAFRQPQGAMFWGISELGYSLQGTFLTGCPFSTWTYSNTTSQSGTFSWTYYDQNNNKQTSTSKDLSYKVGVNDEYVLPTLNATINGSKTSYVFGGAFNTEQGAIYPGGSSYRDSEGNKFDFTNANPDLGLVTWNFSEGEYAFGTGAGQEALVSVFDKPQSSLIFAGANIFATVFSAPANNELELRLITIDTSTGYVEYQDTIAISRLKASDVTTLNGGLKVLKFETFFAIDEDGFESEVEGYFIMDKAFVLELSGFYNNGTQLAVLSEEEDDPDTTKTSFFWMTQDGKRDMYRWTNLPNTMAFSLTDAHYPYVSSDVEVISADINGGSYDMTIVPYFNNYEVIESPEWTTISVLSEQFDQNAWEVKLRAAVDPKPAELEGRYGEIKVASAGTSVTIPVTQGVTGISTSKAEVYTVNVEGNEFVMTYPATATSVSVINVNGQLVGSYSLNANGTTTIPASLANGVYMFKFNGAKSATVKVVR